MLLKWVRLEHNQTSLLIGSLKCLLWGSSAGSPKRCRLSCHVVALRELLQGSSGKVIATQRSTEGVTIDG